jgi:DNA repair exonuclease SbcCD ATPase subunit
MEDLDSYERRITEALDRIEAALASRGVPSAAGGDAGALREALEAERTANAQLTERVRAIKEKQETMVAALERKVAQLAQQLDLESRELQRQKRLNAQLVETNRALTDAASAGVTEPHLLNRAMMTELEALRAARAAEIAEMDDILSELKPLIGEVA